MNVSGWAAVVFVRCGQRTLLVQNAGLPGFWQPAGGHAEAVDRTPADTGVRELREEIGIDIPATALRELGSHPSDRGPETLYAFTTEISPGRRLAVDRTEIDRWGWFTEDRFAELAVLPATAAFLDRLRDRPQDRPRDRLRDRLRER